MYPPGGKTSNIFRFRPLHPAELKSISYFLPRWCTTTKIMDVNSDIGVRNKSGSYCGWYTKTHNFARLGLFLGPSWMVGGVGWKEEKGDKRVEKIKFDLSCLAAETGHDTI